MTLARNLQLHPGVVLEGRYRIERRLGVGGMGEVFLATRLALGDAVAIKSMLPTDDSPQMRERFLVEVRAAARVRHPNVVEIHDFGEPAGGMPYMVMEHLEGPSLAEHLAARGRLTADETRAIFAELCAAVEAAHRRGVVHRDLKPANVILARGDDGRSRVKVLDFGIARIAGADARPLTSPGAIVGTACYMAPEQARGGEVGPAADIFALGVILYELSTGALPFRGDSQLSVLQRICAGVYPPPELHTPGLDAAIVSAIVAALATDPRARPPSAAALAELAGIARVPALAPATATSVMIEDVANRSTLGGHEPTVAAPAEATAQRVTAPPPATRREAHKAPQYQLFSGRERELDQLLGYLAEARRGEGPIAVVSAEPGMGKTRLVEEFAARARADGVAVLSSRFYDYEGSRRSPFAAFQAMLEDEAVALDGAPEPAAVFDALTAAILARAGGRRLALVFDDLQWASRVDLELIEHLHRSLRGRGGLVVATLHAQAASGELERWLATQARGRSCALLELAPLDVAAIRRVLVTALGDLRIRPQELQRLARATGGSPYHLEEVIRHLVARGRLAREGAGGWVCRPLDDVALPETVGALVRGHLQELAGHDALRRVLELAAVIGDEFSCETLALAAGLDEDELDELLEIAVSLRLLREDGVTPGNDLRFHGPAVREVLYADMSRRRRRRAHAQVVAALARRYGESRTLAHVFAYHHEALDDPTAAFAFGLQAVELACERHDNERGELALARARRACARLEADGAPPDPAARARLDACAGTLFVRTGRFEEARGHLVRAEQAALDLDDRGLGIDVALTLAACLVGLSDYAGALEAAHAAHDRARAEGLRLQAARARVFAASVSTRLGRVREAAAYVDEVIAALGPGDPPALRCEAHRERAWQHVKLGEFDRAEREVDRALALARASGDLRAMYSALSIRANCLGESGRHEEGIAVHLEALELARRLCLRRREAIELANLGEAHLQLDRLDEALALFGEALAIFIEIGDRACEGDCRVNVGRAQLACGEPGAVGMLERGRDLCAAMGRREYEAIAWLHLGEAHAAAGDERAALAAFTSARESFAAQESPLVWQASFGCARALHALGDDAEARAQATAALAQLEAQRARLPRHLDPSRLLASAGPLRALLDRLTVADAGARSEDAIISP